ncbi:MAG: hypothetical protein AAGI38_25205 [Bacteroidota bacterium]
MRFKPHCFEIVSDKLIVFSENKRKLTLENSQKVEVTKVTVDGCEITSSALKCDFMAVTSNMEYFVELKGSNVKHAFKQLESSIHLLSEDKVNTTKRCYVISTKSPLTSTQIQIEGKRFKKNYNAVLKVRSNSYKEKL